MIAMKMKGVHITSSVIARFHDKYRKGEADECWNWVAGKTFGGYGVMRCGPGVGVSITGHRFSWTLANGNIPNGMQVIHSCCNRACVNPVHLFIGTNADNNRHKTSKNCKNRKKLTRLVPAQVLKIRKSDLTQAELARLFDVSTHCIWQIKNHITWRNLKDG